MKENYKEKAINIEKLIDYHKGSVVSKEIHRKETGNVTLFAFDKGEGLSEHTAPFDAMIYVLDGEAKVTIAGRLHKVAKGEMIIMPAGKPHSLKAAQRFKMALIMIRSK